MTLAEFLLARIAEDEQKVAAMRRETSRAKLTHRPYDGDHLLTWLAGVDIFVSADRWAAECDAKRRIVQQVSDVRWSGYAVRDVVLQLLALPYADHLDYREEWKS